MEPPVLQRILISWMLLLLCTAAGFSQPVNLQFLNTLDLQNLEEINDVPQLQAVAFDPDGSLYVLDRAGLRLLKLTQSGELLQQAGGFGFGEGSFRGPTDVALAGFEVWVCDLQGGSIQRFNRRLVSLGTIESTQQNRFDLNFRQPVSVSLAPNGDIVVLDSDRQQAVILDREGRAVDVIAQFTDLDQTLLRPVRLEISSQGIMALADPGTGSTLVFDQFGSFQQLLSWTFSGTGPSGLTWWSRTLFVCGDGGLLAYDENQQPAGEWKREFFDGDCVDVAVHGRTLAVGTRTRIHLFTIAGR